VQDIAVVPFLVLLPLVESNDVTTMGAMDLLSQLGPTALQTIGSLGLLLLGGRTILRRVFQVSHQASMGSKPDQPWPPLSSHPG
jgi:predicted Kef-type K+ transport protein